MNRQRTTTAVALTLAAAVALAACTPAPAPSPTAPTTSASSSARPTPTVTVVTPDRVDPPASQDEATVQAIAAIDRYMALRSAVYADPSGTHDITAAADGPAAERLRDEAAQLVDLGIHAQGQFRFEVTSATASDTVVDGVPIPFGTVSLDGCYDSTGVDAFDADGNPAEVAADRRLRFQPTITYRPSTGSWVVYDTPDPAEVQPC